MEKSRNYVSFYINGKKHKATGENVFKSLSDYLRYEKQQVGTKVVCAEGDCGSCTIAFGRIKENKFEYQNINSCIKYVYQLDGTHVISVEGLKSNSCLTAVQECMVNEHGTQCGFCTPGFVVAMTTLYENQDKLSPKDLKDGLAGNLCRCTGYDSIIKAGLNIDSKKVSKYETLYPSKDMIDELKKDFETPIYIEYEDKKFFSPVEISQAINFKNENNNVTIVSGGTDISVQVNKKMRDPDTIMSIASVKDLNEVKVEKDFISFGSRVTLTKLEEYCIEFYPEFADILKVFGSPQIKNSATLSGNIANASPIADTTPFLFIMNAELELTGLNGSRKVNINNFYKGYKVLDLAKDEMITRVFIPILKDNEKLKLYKISKRRDLDISTFTAAFKLVEENNIIKEINIAYGGVGPTILRLKETEEFLKGKELNPTNMNEAGKIAIKEITPISDVRGSKDFRLQLAENILMKLYFDLQDKGEKVCQ